MTLGERIIDIRKKKGISQKDLASQLGITPTRLNYWEKDKRDPSIPMLNLLSEALDVDVNELIGRKQEVYVKEPSSEKESLLIKKYRALDERGKQTVEIVLDMQYQYALERQSQLLKKAKEEKIIILPMPLQSASAGPGQFADDKSTEDVSVVYNEYTAKADYILRVNGDSMEPKFCNGDLVLVREQPAVELGEVGIFLIEGERYIKEYQGQYLHSLNPEWEDVDCTEDTFCRGKVIGVLDEDWIK